MKRSTVITFSLFAAAVAVIGFLTFAGRVSANRVALNTKDLREHNLIVVSPTDPAFEAEVSRITNRKSDKLKEQIDALKPFSVLVKNESSNFVIGYALRWDVTQADGTTISHLRSYTEPSTLLGRDTNKMRDMGAAIAPHSMRYVSIMSPVTESDDGLVTSGVGKDVSSQHAGQISQLAADKNETALIDLLSLQLARSQSLTVTLDAAIFDDGTCVGPDSGGLFARLQALVDAQNHLLRDALRGVDQGKPVKQVFDEMALIADQPVSLTDKSSPGDYYNYYKREFAYEALQMRAAIGDDQKAMWYVTRPTREPRYKLHKKPTNNNAQH